jgi:hypothetical protein
MINLTDKRVTDGFLREEQMNYAVQEVDSLTRWEALRLLMRIETFLVFPRANGHFEELPPKILWRSWCDIKEAMYTVLGECERAYLREVQANLEQM